MTRNTLGDLNNHLFEALERINDESLEGAALDAEIRRAQSVAGISAQIIKSGRLALAALRAKDEACDAGMALPPMLKAGDGR
ncbi:MAG: hypothetical protein LBL86_12140 [Coriobacteriales bacterium]|jgi:hypothetical protein|nr:hypothetical protein [Coriobacteriales bacterium]